MEQEVPKGVANNSPNSQQVKQAWGLSSNFSLFLFLIPLYIFQI
jgi:hypothetical protein